VLPENGEEAETCRNHIYMFDISNSFNKFDVNNGMKCIIVVCWGTTEANVWYVKQQDAYV
jgi:hypothetical protein